MTTSEELDYFCEKYLRFEGIECLKCVSKDNFYIDKKIPIYYQIINLDYNTHWVLFFKINRICYYFDSFGQPPFSKLIDELKEDYRLFYNIKQFQKITEINCGERCLHQIIRICQKITYI